MIFSYPAFRKQMMLSVKIQRFIWQSPARLQGPGEQPSTAPSAVPPAGHQPDPQCPCVGLCHHIRQGDEWVQPQTAVVAFPSALFSPLYTIISKTRVSLLPHLRWSRFGPFSKGSGTSPPGPWPGGAARNETQLSLKL